LLKKIAYPYTKRKTTGLFVLVIFASLSLIVVNFYTLRITSAIRAYISGESEYSKSQKDAFLHLSNYTRSWDENYWALFVKEMAVPRGDHLARVALALNSTDESIKKGFLMGGNNPVDFDDMIWLYKKFHTLSFMQKAIKAWEEAGPLINEADSLSSQIHAQIEKSNFTPALQQAYLNSINIITAELSKKERIFANVLGNTARTINNYLFWINVFCIVLILGSLVSYAIIMINRLSKVADELERNNIELTNLNRELDTFVYSASHDLRSPIASLRGLIDVTINEEDPDVTISYLELMNNITESLDFFIIQILDFFKNKRTTINTEKLSLQKLADDAITLVRFMPVACNINITKEINADVLYSDELRMKMILNNLLSNAIKYNDPHKEKRYIKIRTKNVDNRCIIEVEDNGIGIKKEHHQHIFDMFFAMKKTKGSTGLGLYIVKETVQKLHGDIKVVSEINAGSTFIISLPGAQQHQN